MATTWYVQRDDKLVGPISAKQLRELARSNDLHPEDLVRKGNDGDFIPAKRIKNLFQEPSPVTTQQRLEQEDLPTNEVQPDSGTPLWFRLLRMVYISVLGILTTIGKWLIYAGKRGGIHARKAQLQTIKLPNTFTALGQNIYSENRYSEEFTSLYSQIAEALIKQSEISATDNNHPPNNDLSTNIKGAKDDILRYGKNTSLGLKLKSLYRQLGENAYQKYGEASGPTDLISEITDIENELKTLNEKTHSLKSEDDTTVSKSRRLVIPVLLVCFIFISYFGWGFVSKQLSSSDIAAKEKLNGENPTSSTNDLGSKLSQQTRQLKKQAFEKIVTEDKKQELEQKQRNERIAGMNARRENQMASNIQAIVKARLDEWKRMYDVRSGINLNYPNRPRIAPPIRIFEKPSATFETQFDEIKNFKISPDGHWLNYENRFANANDFKPLKVNRSFLANPLQLSYTKSCGINPVSSTEFVRNDTLKKFNSYYDSRVTNTNLFEGQSFISKNSSLWVGFEPWGLNGNPFGDGGNGYAVAGLSFWKLANNELSLIDIYAVSDGYDNNNMRNFPLVAVDGCMNDQEAVVLVRNQATHSNVRLGGVYQNIVARGNQVQVWRSTGLVGSADISYKVGSGIKYAQYIVSQPNGKHIALHYGDTVQLFKTEDVKDVADNVQHVARLESDFPVPNKIDAEGYLKFSPDGKTLAVGFPVHDKQNDEKFILLRFYLTKDWSLISETKATRSNTISFSPDGTLFVTSPAFEVFNVSDGTRKYKFSVRDGTNAVFLGNHKLAIGGASRQPRMYTTANGDRKRFDVSDTNINIFDLRTGVLWGRIPLKNARAIAVSPDGNEFYTSVDKFINKPAIIQKWQFDRPSEIVPFTDEFQLYREVEFRENQGTSRDKGNAPAVMPDDYKKIVIGMTYDEVIRILLGRGKLEASALEVDKSKYGYDTMIRANVVYEAVSDKEPALYQLTFEGDLHGDRSKLKLVKKTKLLEN